MSRSKTLVAIPAYNCGKQIPRVVGGFDDKLLERVEKVIIIDNGSNDNTIDAAKKSIKKTPEPSKFEVWKNIHNYNLGGTHKVAFLAGEKLGVDYVAILHGDNQAETLELHSLLDVAQADGTIGAILGCRFMRGSKLVGYDWKRTWGNKAINAAYSVIALRPSKDLGSGLNLFRLSDLADHRYLGFGDTITFNIDMLLDYFSKRTPIKFVPITWREEDQVSNARNFKVGSTALKKLFLWRFGKTTINPKPANYYKSAAV